MSHSAAKPLASSQCGVCWTSWCCGAIYACLCVTVGRVREKVLASKEGLFVWEADTHCNLRCVEFAINSFLRQEAVCTQTAWCDLLFWPWVCRVTLKSIRSVYFLSRSEAQYCPPTSLPLLALESRKKQGDHQAPGWKCPSQATGHDGQQPVPHSRLPSLMPAQAPSSVPQSHDSSVLFTVLEDRGFILWSVIKLGLLFFLSSALQSSLTPWQPHSVP